MPSVVTKPDKIPSVEGLNHVSQALVVLEKKVRNLEKRKGKLDAYKVKLKQGEELNKEQQDAVDQYEVVEKTLLFARELAKQYTQLSAEVEKQRRKQQKREQIEKANHEIRRIGEILQLQNLLNELGTEEVREDFLEGKNNAIVLTSEQLDTFDELYKLIAPSRDTEDEIPYHEQVAAASEHIVCLLDAKDKEIIGTTYSQLHELISKIQSCGYFSKAEPETPTSEDKKLDDDAGSDINLNEYCTTPSEDGDNALIGDSCVVDADGSYVPQESGDTLPWNTEKECTPEGFILVDQVQGQVIVDHPEQVLSIEHLSLDQNSMVSSLESQEFHNPNYYISQQTNRSRPLNEIVSSVSGDFTFLQESTVVQEPPTTHMDPAVLAAHPMGTNLVSSSHSGAVNNDSQVSSVQQTLITDSSSLPTQPTIDGFTLQTQGNAYQDSYIKHNSLNQQFTPIGENNNSVLIIESSKTSLTPSVDSFEEDGIDEETKKFTMNPNAAMFHSQYDPSPGDDDMDESLDDNRDFNSGSNNSDMHGGFTSYNSRGGQRGRGGRGGRGSFNGYGPRGGRGGNSNQYGGRGGFQNRGSRGSFNSNRGSSRGSRSDRGGPRGGYASSIGSQPSRINFASEKAQ